MQLTRRVYVRVTRRVQALARSKPVTMAPSGSMGHGGASLTTSVALLTLLLALSCRVATVREALRQRGAARRRCAAAVTGKSRQVMSCHSGTWLSSLGFLRV